MCRYHKTRRATATEKFGLSGQHDILAGWAGKDLGKTGAYQVVKLLKTWKYLNYWLGVCHYIFISLTYQIRVQYTNISNILHLVMPICVCSGVINGKVYLKN